MLLLARVTVACGLLNPAGARLAEADRLLESGEGDAAEAVYLEVAERWPESDEARRAREGVCRVRTGRATDAWATATEGLAVLASMPVDALRDAMKEAEWKLDSTYRGSLVICSRAPDAVSCREAPTQIRLAKATWAKALLAWLEEGARRAAAGGMARAMAAEDDVLASPATVWADGVRAERERAATEWVSAAIRGLPASYREDPFGVTDADPDPAAIGAAAAGTLPPIWDSVVDVVEAAREACGR